MYQFIEDNFFPQQKFIQISTRASSIHWNLLSGKIISVTGMHEFVVIFKRYLQNIDIKERFIFDCVPLEIYNKVRDIALRYYYNRRKNNSKQFIVVFAINNDGILDSESPGIFVHVYINNNNNIGLLTLSRADAIAQLNNKILLIIELFGDFKGRIAFATSLQENCTMYLINNEYDILQLLAKGYTSEKISKLLCLSKHTVNDVRKDLLEKFKAKNILQLIYHAHKEGYI